MLCRAHPHRAEPVPACLAELYLVAPRRTLPLQAQPRLARSRRFLPSLASPHLATPATSRIAGPALLCPVASCRAESRRAMQYRVGPAIPGRIDFRHTLK